MKKEDMLLRLLLAKGADRIVLDHTMALDIRANYEQTLLIDRKVAAYYLRKKYKQISKLIKTNTYIEILGFKYYHN